MTATTRQLRRHPILPADRIWPVYLDTIAHQIIAAIGEVNRTDRAALHLLFRTPGQPWAYDDVAQAATQGWPALIDALDGHADLGTEERYLVDLLAGITGIEIGGLGAIFAELGQASCDALAEAIAILRGAR